MVASLTQRSVLASTWSALTVLSKVAEVCSGRQRVQPYPPLLALLKASMQSASRA